MHIPLRRQSLLCGAHNQTDRSICKLWEEKLLQGPKCNPPSAQEQGKTQKVPVLWTARRDFKNQKDNCIATNLKDRFTSFILLPFFQTDINHSKKDFWVGRSFSLHTHQGFCWHNMLNVHANYNLVHRVKERKKSTPSVTFSHSNGSQTFTVLFNARKRHYSGWQIQNPLTPFPACEGHQVLDRARYWTTVQCYCPARILVSWLW